MEEGDGSGRRRIGVSSGDLTRMLGCLGWGRGVSYGHWFYRSALDREEDSTGM